MRIGQRAERRPQRWPARVRHLVPLVALFVCVVGAKFALIGSAAVETPFWDQWDAEADHLYAPFLTGRLRGTDLFAAHNEHRILVPRVLWLLILVLNGLWDPRVQMVVNAGLHAGCAVLIAAAIPVTFGYLRRFCVVGLLVVLFGAAHGWENTLAGFQSQFYLVLLFSLSVLVTVSRFDGVGLKWWPVLGLASLGATFSLASGFVAPAAGAGLVATIALLRRRLDGVLVRTFVFLSACTVLGLAAIVSVPDHAALRADGWSDFVVAFGRNAAWPFINRPYLAFPLQLPLLALLWIRLRRGGGDSTAFRLAVGLGLWALLQAAVLALGRGHGGGAPASRYSDVLAIGVVANAIAALLLRTPRWPCLYRISLCLWLAFVAAGVAVLDHRARERPDQIPSRRLIGQLHESYVSRYLATGDRAYLHDKPGGHIPYPTAARLQTLLDRPDIQATLPTAIRLPLNCAPIAAEGFTAISAEPSTVRSFGVAAYQPGLRSSIAGLGRLVLRCPPPERTGRLAIRLAFPEGYGEDLRVNLVDASGGQQSLFMGSPAPLETLILLAAPQESFVLEIVDRDTQRS